MKYRADHNDIGDWLPELFKDEHLHGLKLWYGYGAVGEDNEVEERHRAGVVELRGEQQAGGGQQSSIRRLDARDLPALQDFLELVSSIGYGRQRKLERELESKPITDYSVA